MQEEFQTFDRGKRHSGQLHELCACLLSRGVGGMWREIAPAVPQPFALVITRPPSVAQVLSSDAPFLEFEMENRGRDILPVMKALCEENLPLTGYWA